MFVSVARKETVRQMVSGLILEIPVDDLHCNSISSHQVLDMVSQIHQIHNCGIKEGVSQPGCFQWSPSTAMLSWMSGLISDQLTQH